MKKNVYHALTCILALTLLFTTTTFAVDSSYHTVSDVKLYSRSGEEINVPEGTIVENGIYRNFYDSVAKKEYDFYNSETGEYFRTFDEDDVVSTNGTYVTDKRFEFNITASVTSSKFKISGKPAYLIASAKIVNDVTGKDVTNNTHKFTISMERTSLPFTSRTYTEKVKSGMSKTMDWVVSLKYYKIIVINPNDLHGTPYTLKGNGKVYHIH